MEWVIWAVAGLGLVCGVVDVVLQRRANRLYQGPASSVAFPTPVPTGPATIRPIFSLSDPRLYKPQPESEPFYSPYPVLGWRVMMVGASGVGVGHQLHVSGAHGKQWDHPYLEARCQRHCPLDELNWRCECGIYAYNEPKTALGSTATSQWGNFVFLTAMEHVLQYTRGYRAGRAWLIGGAPPYPLRSQLPIKRTVEAFLPPGHVSSSILKLERVADYYTKNPERIPTWEQWVTLCAESNR